MADRDDLEFTYSLIDRIFRLSLGELADFSAAKYDGDFTLSLKEAQRRKHEYVAEQIGIGPGPRVLDLGCGWGPLLDFVRRRGGTGVGVTLSSAQAAACRRHGLDVHLHDARQVTPEVFGPFDAVASLAFEHFCSVEAYRARRQEESQTVRPDREPAARPRPVRPSDDGVRAEHDRAGPDRHQRPAGLRRVLPRAYGMAVPRLLPSLRPGADHPQRQVALPPRVEHSGRLDYIETIPQWRTRFAAPSPRKTLLKLQLLPRWLTSADFRLAFTSGVSADSVCFERELLDHYRLVFEKDG
jgi:cyclopropane-fatty-acyl-phospholipid synthase